MGRGLTSKIMRFLSNILSATVKTIALPIAAVVDVATLGKAEATKTLAEDALEDLDDALSGK